MVGLPPDEPVVPTPTATPSSIVQVQTTVTALMEAVDVVEGVNARDTDKKVREVLRETFSSPSPSPAIPAKRLFTGVASSPLAQVSEPTAEPPLPKVTRMRDMVLLHYCFDQQAGETKNEHCFCEERAERVQRDLAEEYVKDGLADYLVVKNSRAKTGTSIFRRALAIRSVVIDGHKLFAVSSKWKPKNSRDEKHEAIKATIRDRAKNLMRKMFSKGVIAQDVFQRLQTDAELDSLFAQ
jgi:hypothetical protein